MDAVPALFALPMGSVKAISSRDRLSALVSEHFDFVWRLVRRLGISREDADDTTQQVFMAVVRRIDAVESGRERAFLYGVVLRTVANVQRSVRRRREEPALELDRVASSDHGPERHAELAQARDLLDGVLGRLPASLRTVLVLVEIEGLGVAEAAALEAIPTGTAASRLRRARELFQLELSTLGARSPFSSGEP